MSDTLNEYAFDIELAGALRVKATDEADARAQLAEAIEAADTNFGAWRNGDPILGETSLRGTPSLYQVNGEDVDEPGWTVIEASGADAAPHDNTQLATMILNLIEYAEKYAAANNEPADGDCRKVIAEATDFITPPY